MKITTRLRATAKKKDEGRKSNNLVVKAAYYWQK